MSSFQMVKNYNTAVCQFISTFTESICNVVKFKCQKLFYDVFVFLCLTLFNKFQLKMGVYLHYYPILHRCFYTIDITHLPVAIHV